ncbi:transmembrane protein 42-like [Astyanax mexicanus]|uniref:transmembrane protein 42 n=1 Tax=Astyanax mexicanus TaxID=7994 RepID=UPI0020CAA23B|nr:transmembrane protein 42 [Astyanax mexicanus]XP_049329129.1 transmembrane protein 42-like [Astyanax mexicanus]
MFPGVVYALLAGFLGAVASSSAKLSLGTDYLKGVCETGLRSWGEQRRFRQGNETTACDWLHIPLRLLCGGLLFTCNAVMWTFLSKALRYSSSSTRTTVTTTASNFISSAFLGQLIFGDSHIALWWVGISLTLSGLLVLHRASPSETSHEDEIKRTSETARGPERAEKPA